MTCTHRSADDRFSVVGVCSIAVLLCAPAFAQTPVVIGTASFRHATANLEKTTAFYRDIFGLAQPEPPIPPNPAAPDLIGVPGAQLQARVFRIPDESFGWELTHFGGIDLEPGQAQVLDPGAAELIVEVRDMDPVLAAIRKSGAPILSRNGAPVKLEKLDAMSLMARDPDGFIFQVLRIPSGVAAPAPRANVQGAMMSLTVSDMEATLSFYRDLLGFRVTEEMEFLGNPAVLDAGGLPDGSQYRQMEVSAPGAYPGIRIVLFEAKGVPRTPFRLRVADPGAPAIQLLVSDLDGLLNRMKAAGVKIVSTGGIPVQFIPQIRSIFVEDPDGFKIELDQVSQ